MTKSELKSDAFRNPFPEFRLPMRVVPLQTLLDDAAEFLRQYGYTVTRSNAAYPPRGIEAPYSHRGKK